MKILGLSSSVALGASLVVAGRRSLCDAVVYNGGAAPLWCLGADAADNNAGKAPVRVAGYVPPAGVASISFRGGLPLQLGCR